MQPTYTFTKQQILNHALNNWTLEPLTPAEHAYLGMLTQDTYDYAMDDIDSLILELISEMDSE